MNTKKLFKNLAIILAFTLGAFSFYSFTTDLTSIKDVSSYDQSLYQNLEADTPLFNFANAENEKCGAGKCGDDKKEAKAKKDSKCGDGKCGDDKNEAKAKEDGKCGDGKCGDDKKEAKEAKSDKKADEGKDAKCGTGKCG